MPPLRKPLTHKDIARMVGVSQSTVSRALDPANRHLISEKVVEEIARIAQETGFQGNILARRLRNRRAETVTVVIPSTSFSTYRNIDFEAANHVLIWLQIQGMMHEAMARGYDVKLVPQFNEDPLLEQQLLSHFGYPHSDGVVFAGLGTVPTTDGLKKRGIPFITTHHHPDERCRPLLTFDQLPGIAAGLRHLIAKGHRRIAFMTFAPGYATEPSWIPRFTSFRDTLVEAGLFDPALVFCLPSEADLRRHLRDTLTSRPYTAAFCVNDNLAGRLVRELVFADMKVPGDIAVLGFDNNPHYRNGEHALTTVDLPMYELGRRALQLLIDAIEDKGAMPRLEKIPSLLVTRRSA